MATLAEMLRRIRFHGVPGAPSAIGVPADRSRELEAELEPVLALLDADQAQVQELLDRAARDAAQRRASAVEQGLRLVGEARARTDVVRAEAANESLARAAGDRAALRAAAQLEVERVERVAAERLPVLVDAVVRRVLSFGMTWR